MPKLSREVEQKRLAALRQEIEESRPDRDAETNEVIGWLADLASVRSVCREPEAAADAIRDAIAIEPSHPDLHCSLADALGRAGHHEEARAEAMAAIALSAMGGDMAVAFYARAALCLAVWEAALGNLKNAESLFDGVSCPDDPEELWGYYTRRCDYYAVLGDEKGLRRAVKDAMKALRRRTEMGGFTLPGYLANDILFDKFSGQDWFQAALD